MIRLYGRTLTRKDGSTVRKVYAFAAGETVGPLDLLPAHVPPVKRGEARTAERVRANRAGTWAVWTATDVRA